MVQNRPHLHPAKVDQQYPPAGLAALYHNILRLDVPARFKDIYIHLRGRGAASTNKKHFVHPPKAACTGSGTDLAPAAGTDSDTSTWHRHWPGSEPTYAPPAAAGPLGSSECPAPLPRCAPPLPRWAANRWQLCRRGTGPPPAPMGAAHQGVGFWVAVKGRGYWSEQPWADCSC